MTTSQSQARRAAPILLAAAVTFIGQDGCVGLASPRHPRTAKSADALALAFQSAGRAAGRASLARLAKAIRAGKLAALTAAMVAEGGTKVTILRSAS